MLKAVAARTTTLVISGGAGAATACLFALVMSSLVAVGENPNPASAHSLVMAAPPPRTRVEPEKPRPVQPRQEREIGRPPRRTASPAEPPLPEPVLPALCSAPALTATTGLALPSWEGTALAAGTGPVHAADRGRRERQEPFRWVYAPEKESRAAMARRYPRYAARRGLEGNVLVEWQTAPGGEVVRAQVCSASPPGLFERAALVMVKSWRGSRQAQGRIMVKFRLDDLM